VEGPAVGTAPQVSAASPVELLVTDRLGDHAEAWDRLVALAPIPAPFLRSWWLEAMALRGDACFLLVTARGDLIGGLALERRRALGLPVLRALGAGPLNPDHLDLVAAAGQEGVVAAALRTELHRRGSRLIDLAGIAVGHRLQPALGDRPLVTEDEEAPWVPLPATYDEYRATLPPILRNSIRRSTNRLARQGDVAFRVVGSPDVERSLARLRVLHAEQFGPDSGFIEEFERFSAAARAGHPLGEIRLFELWVGDQVAAVDVAFTVCGRMSYYQGGRSLDDRFSGAGTVLMAGGFEWACGSGLREVDFLRGTEPYKTQWAPQRRRLVRVRVGVGAAGSAALRAARLRESPRVRSLGRRVKAVLRDVGRPRPDERPSR
jgi:CelD/BcsL family acetyltransferase involved in cellulose biosynthesis